MELEFSSRTSFIFIVSLRTNHDNPKMMIYRRFSSNFSVQVKTFHSGTRARVEVRAFTVGGQIMVAICRSRTLTGDNSAKGGGRRRSGNHSTELEFELFLYLSSVSAFCSGFRFFWFVRRGFHMRSSISRLFGSGLEQDS